MKISLGKYVHYKGGEYEVIGIANHSETLKKLVLYKSLYESDDFAKGTLWARPVKLFSDTVDVDGKIIQRFKKI